MAGSERPGSRSMMDKVKVLPRLAELSSYMPRRIRSGSSECIIKDNLRCIFCRCSVLAPGWGGISLASGNYQSRDRYSEYGYVPMQILIYDTTGMHWHTHHDGALYTVNTVLENLSGGVALGGDPAITYAATAPLPPGIDELVLAGFLP